jgi:hypothetical protein
MIQVKGIASFETHPRGENESEQYAENSSADIPADRYQTRRAGL